MNIEDFVTIIDQMKRTTVPKRLIFIWSGSTKELENILEGIEFKGVDVASANTGKQIASDEIQHILEDYLDKECQSYEENRNEPSALIVQNAILLARYHCDMSPIFRHGISPRSAVILIFPKESHKQLPPRAEGWIRRDTRSVLLNIAKQLGELDCLIEM